MFTVKTSEIRWFIKGGIPEEANQWFEKICPRFVSENARIDTYLLMKDTTEVGIKVRQGRMEVKKIHGQGGIMEIGPGIEGIREIWQKWSFRIDSEEELPLAFKLESSSWVEVRKKRKLSRYSVEDNHLVSLSNHDPFPENGVHLELTEISINQEIWHTVGAESFGSDRLIEANLHGIAEKLLATYPFKNLGRNNSLSYPAWLKGHSGS